MNLSLRNLRLEFSVLLLIAIGGCGGGGGNPPATANSGGPPATPAIFASDLHLADIDYHPGLERVLASVTTRSPKLANSLVVINPATGMVESNIQMPEEPGRVRLADDQHTLYIASRDKLRLRKVDLTAKSMGAPFTLAPDPFLGVTTFQDFLPLPNHPGSLVVIKGFWNSSETVGPLILDGGVPRPDSPAFPLLGSLTLSEDSSKLYALHSSSGSSLFTFKITPSGVEFDSKLEGISRRYAINVENQRNRLFLSSGEILDAQSPRILGRVDQGSDNQQVNPDLAHDRILVAGKSGISLFDPVTLLPIAQRPATQACARLLRVGADWMGALKSIQGSGDFKLELISMRLPVITSFTGPTQPVSPGQAVTLSWTVSNATSVSLEGIGAQAGSTYTAAPSQTTTYSLKVVGASGWSVTKQVIVNVIPASTGSQVELQPKDLIYSPVTLRCYASLPASASTGGNSIVILNPESGVIEGSIYVGSDPGAMALADDGRTLFVALDGAGSVVQLDLVTQQVIHSLELGRTEFNGWRFPSGLAPLAGSPGSIAVSANYGNKFSSAGVLVFDDGVLRGPATNLWDCSVLVPSTSGDHVYAYQFGKITSLAISQAGDVTPTPIGYIYSPPNTSSETITLQQGKFFSDGGDVVNETDGHHLGQFCARGPVCPDVPSGRVLIAVGPEVFCYDLESFRLLGRLTAGFPVKKMVRWGSDGLAVMGSGKIAFLHLRIPSIQSVGFDPPSIVDGDSTTLRWDVSNADTVEISSIGTITGSSLSIRPGQSQTFTITARNAFGSSSAMSAITVSKPAGKFTLDFPCNDMVYSPRTGKAYAAIPDGPFPFPNSLLVIDPTRAMIENAIPIGSQPYKLAISDDGSVLYAALAGSFAVRRIDLLTQVMDPPFHYSNSVAPDFVSDMLVLPDTQDSLAIVSGYMGMEGINPTRLGIFDRGTPRAGALALNRDQISKIQPGNLPNQLFGMDTVTTGASLYTLEIDGTGIQMLPTQHSVGRCMGDVPFKIQNGRIFLTGGKILNASDHTISGTITDAPPGMTNPCLGPILPDIAKKNIIVGSNHRVLLFDSESFQRKNDLPTQTKAHGIIRWGDDGLAVWGDEKAEFLRLPSPKISRFTASSRAIMPGATVDLTWEVSGATDVTISGIGTVSGNSVSVSPSSTTVYVLTASANGGFVTAEVRVEVDSKHTIRNIGVLANDAVYSSLTQRLYISVPGGEWGSGNTITTVDPITGTIERELPVGSEPGPLALLGDDRTLLIGLGASGSVRKLDVIDGTLAPEVPLGYYNQYWGALPVYEQLRFTPQRIIPIPGSMDSFFVAFGKTPFRPGVEAATIGAKVLDAGGPRPEFVWSLGKEVSAANLTSLTLRPEDPTRPLGFADHWTGPVVTRLSLAPEGLTVDQLFHPVVGLKPGEMLACDGKLFFSNGTVLDANDCSQIGSLSAQPGRSAMAAVPQTHTLFMANLGKVIALDSTTLQPKGSISLPFTVGRIIPFGSEGLMVVESGSQVAYLIKASDLH